MTREQAKQLVYSDLDHIRTVTAQTADSFHALTPALAAWIGVASKKELLAEMICLLASNHNAAKKAA